MVAQLRGNVVLLCLVDVETEEAKDGKRLVLEQHGLRITSRK